MPNWCYTTYVCEGSKENLDKLYNALEAIKNMDVPHTPNGFGKLWIGCLIDYVCGRQGAYNDFGCRGEITEYEYDGDIIHIHQMTAWGELPDFRKFLRGYFDVKVYYLEDEECNMVLNTNDTEKKYFKYDWYLSSERVSEEFETFEALSDCLSEHYGFRVYESSYEEALERLDYQDDYINIRKLMRFRD